MTESPPLDNQPNDMPAVPESYPGPQEVDTEFTKETELNWTSEQRAVKVVIPDNYGCHDTDIILAISTYKALYDRSNIYYTDTETKAHIWEAIAKELNIEVNYAKKRWKNLRDTYTKSLRQRKGNSAGDAAGGPAKEWKYTKHMEFLASHIDPNSRTPTPKESQIVVTSEGIQVAVDGSDESYHPSNATAPVSSISGHAIIKKETNRRKTPPMAPIYVNSKPSQLQQLLEAKKRPKSESPKEPTKSKGKKIPRLLPGGQSAEELFARSLIPTLERMTNRQKAQAKLQIQDVLYRIEFGMLHLSSDY